MKLRVHNESLRPLILSIEPNPDLYELAPGEQAVADGDFEKDEDGAVFITLHESDVDGRCVVLYGEGDVAVTKLGAPKGPWDGMTFEPWRK